MTDAQYQAAVVEARTLVKRSEEDQWRLAQLTWEQAPEVGFKQWAEDIGVHISYARRLSAIWQSHRKDDVSSRLPFNEAYKEVSPASAYQTPLDRQSVTEKAVAIQEALKDPEVASKVFSDSGTKSQAIMAIHHNDQHLPPAPPAPQPPAPTKLDVLVLLGEAKDTFRRAFRVGVSLGLAGDADVLSDLGDALDEGEKFHQYLMGMGLDEAIEKIMEGSDQ
jgi:hypothetical protein